MTNNEVGVSLTQAKSDPLLVLKLAALQFLVSVLFSLVLYFCFDTREALSALFGGLIATLASLIIAGRLFTTKSGSVAGELLIGFYISVVLKALFTISMMAICIIVIKVSMLPFIIAYLLAAVVVNWLFLLYRAH